MLPSHLKAAGFAWKKNAIAAFSMIPAITAVFAQTTTPTAPEPTPDQGTIILSPFVVTADVDDSYSAKDTLAGNRTRTNLSDVGSSVQVVTKKFLTDTNSKTVEDLLVLTTNTEVSGQGGNFVGQGGGATLTAQPMLAPVTRVRGLDAADLTQDFFLTRIPFDAYNTDRVDIQRGPNSILFGIGSPGGIINATTNLATFRNKNKIENQIGSFGSVRNTVDLNRVLLNDELAIRLSWLDDDTNYRQVPAFKKDQRLFGSLRWEPRLLNKGSSHTSLTVSAEHGRITGNPPVETPPIDAITPYFTSPLFRDSNDKLLTYTAATNASSLPSSPWLTSSPGGGGSDYNITTFESGGSQGISFYGVGVQWPDKSLSNLPAGRLFGIATYDGFAVASNLPGASLGAYKAKSLTDSSIFNFYDKLLEGPNGGERDTFDTYTVNLTQTFLHNKVGFNLAYNHQDSNFSSYSLLSNYNEQITIDILSTLPDGNPNPNVGRPLVIANQGYGNWSTDVRDTFRLTGYGELDFKDYLNKGSLITKLLGRHVFTGLIDHYRLRTERRNFNNSFIQPDGNNWQSQTPANIETAFNETSFVYLGSAVNGLGNPSGINLNGITGRISYQPTTQNLFNDITGSFVGAPLSVINNQAQSDTAKLYTGATLKETIINSRVVTWQAYLFNGMLVPMVGYRTDSSSDNVASAPVLTTLPWVDTSPSVYKLPPAPTARAKGHSNTYSVVAHLPEALSKRLPWGLNISPFFNQSENFQPAAGRIDLQGDPLPSPTGKTREYGVVINALADRLSLKITRYKSSADNVSIPGGIDPVFNTIIGLGWGQSQYLAMTHPDVAVPYSFLQAAIGTTSSGQTLYFSPPGGGPYTQAEIDAEYIVQQAAVQAWASQAQLSPQMQKVYGMFGYNDPATYASNFASNPSVVVTGSTVSKGTEFELSAHPVPGLLVALNASRTDAQRTNLAGTFVDFMNYWAEVLAGPAGDMRLFGGSPGSAFYTERNWFTLVAAPQVNFYLASNGTQAPEIRRWRFNGTVDYTFRNGAIKGTHIGGSYRWEDGNITGYPVIINNGVSTYDAQHPYHGSATNTVDLWVGYSRNIGKSLLWRTQLNVRNVFAKKDLTVVTVEPDGTPAGMKINPPRVISWTNTLEF